MIPLIPTRTIKEWLHDKPTPPWGGAVPMGYVWGLSVDLLEARGEKYPYGIEVFKGPTEQYIKEQIPPSNLETSIIWRGSVGDLVTDLDSVLTAEEQIKLGEELILKIRLRPNKDI